MYRSGPGAALVRGPTATAETRGLWGQSNSHSGLSHDTLRILSQLLWGGGTPSCRYSGSSTSRGTSCEGFVSSCNCRPAACSVSRWFWERWHRISSPLRERHFFRHIFFPVFHRCARCWAVWLWTSLCVPLTGTVLPFMKSEL